MPDRKLTPEEIALARTMYGNSLDYGKVTISSRKAIFLQPDNYAMTVSETVYMDNRFSDDYTQESPERRALFIHELAHVWQFQNKVLIPLIAAAGLALRHKFNYRGKAYFYELQAGKDLVEYGIEEQAEIIEEYFAQKHLKDTSLIHRCTNTCTDAERLALYEDVLKNFLKDPGYAKRKSFKSIFKKPKPPQA